eukprot:6176554-Pleurochrysis_carterae.AAC.2
MMSGSFCTIDCTRWPRRAADAKAQLSGKAGRRGCRRANGSHHRTGRQRGSLRASADLHPLGHVVGADPETRVVLRHTRKAHTRFTRRRGGLRSGVRIKGLQGSGKTTRFRRRHTRGLMRHA